jgi:hypothetical protein
MYVESLLHSFFERKDCPTVARFIAGDGQDNLRIKRLDGI